MFNKLKHLKDLRSQAKTMENALALEITTVEKNGITVEMNGNMEINSIKLDSSLTIENIESSLPGVINEAMNKTKRLMAQKMQEMGGLSGLGM